MIGVVEQGREGLAGVLGRRGQFGEREQGRETDLGVTVAQQARSSELIAARTLLGENEGEIPADAGGGVLPGRFGDAPRVSDRLSQTVQRPEGMNRPDVQPEFIDRSCLPRA